MRRITTLLVATVVLVGMLVAPAAGAYSTTDNVVVASDENQDQFVALAGTGDANVIVGGSSDDIYVPGILTAHKFADSGDSSTTVTGEDIGTVYWDGITEAKTDDGNSLHQATWDEGSVSEASVENADTTGEVVLVEETGNLVDGAYHADQNGMSLLIATEDETHVEEHLSDTEQDVVTADGATELDIPGTATEFDSVNEKAVASDSTEVVVYTNSVEGTAAIQANDGDTDLYQADTVEDVFDEDDIDESDYETVSLLSDDIVADDLGFEVSEIEYASEEGLVSIMANQDDPEGLVGVSDITRGENTTEISIENVGSGTASDVVVEMETEDVSVSGADTEEYENGTLTASVTSISSGEMVTLEVESTSFESAPMVSDYATSGGSSDGVTFTSLGVDVPSPIQNVFDEVDDIVAGMSFGFIGLVFAAGVLVIGGAYYYTRGVEQ